MQTLFISVAFESNDDTQWISEIAAARTDGSFGVINSKSVLAAFTTKIASKDSEEGLEFKDAFSMLLAKCVQPFTDRYIVVTHYLQLTHHLLRADCKRADLPCFEGRTWIDTAQLAWPLSVMGHIPSRRLEDLGKYYGVNVPDRELTPADTCSLTANVYMHMMRRYSLALKGEAVLRDIGGDTLQSLRGMIGL